MTVKSLGREQTRELFENSIAKNPSALRFLGSNIVPFLDKIEVGESLLVSYDEWKPRAEVSWAVRKYYLKNDSSKKFNTRRVRHLDSWVIIRIK